ncbi:hypothetical protein FQN54_001513 [Arachnomyces sp. PD_36]|nr:hypothetical protein FQN54_001513 [Arachnomyces sp. PD_36]
MRLSLLSALLPLLSTAVAQTLNSPQQEWPINQTVYTDAVQWDHYSLWVNQERLFVWSGEFHYWRIPVPALWRDLLEKVKAHGFNTVSFYGNWGYHSASPDALDFETETHDPRPLLEIAKEIGLYVIYRPGPYVNAEAHSGGFAQWVTNGKYGPLRNGDERYSNAYKPYMDAYEQLLEPYQIQNGGNLIVMQIENEFEDVNPSTIHYMHSLKEQARSNGIGIPLSHNNPNQNSKAWSYEYNANAGAVDLYGLDTYPFCWSCNASECGGTTPYTVVDYYQNFAEAAPNQPPYLPEFQGGSYSPWGAPARCIEEQNSEFVNIMYRHNLGERLTMVSVYMFFGGTNWGNIGYSPSITSYDYSAAISESRIVDEKYWEGKNTGLFIDVASDLSKTDRIYVGTEWSSSPDVNVSVLANPDTNAKFYVLTHAPSNSTLMSNFTLPMETSAGELEVPTSGSASLHGLAAKVLLSDFPFGKHTLLYSTAEVLTASIVDGEEILVLWVPNGESAEFAIKDYAASQRGPKIVQTCPGCDITFQQPSYDKILTVNFQQEAGISIVDFDGFRVVLVDRGVAWKTYVPKLSNAPVPGLDKNIIVHGPHLVRSAAIKGKTLELRGDTDYETVLKVHAPAKVSRISWNGADIKHVKRKDRVLEATLPGPRLTEEDVLSQLNEPSEWSYADTLPEISPEYDDSKWIVANKTETAIPTKPETLPVLYAEDYDIYHGYVLFRGHFPGSTSITSVFLNIQFGNAGGFSAYLNGHFLGSWIGTIDISGSDTFTFPEGVLNVGEDEENVLVILMDHQGKDQREKAVTDYRGVTNVTLDGGGEFTEWRIQGNAGGISNIDPIRGPYNEGGLYAERAGWHLPNFKTETWKTTPTLSSAAVTENPTVTFFRKEFDLKIPTGYDVPLAIKLSGPGGQELRAQIWINGYQYGKYIPHVGKQDTFPFPPGILNYNGSNTLAISLWDVGGKGVGGEEDSGVSLDLEWVVLALYESSTSSNFESESLRPGWDEMRLEYS